MFSIRSTSCRRVCRASHTLLHFRSISTMNTAHSAAPQQQLKSSSTTTISQKPGGEQSAIAASPQPTKSSAGEEELNALTRSIDRITLASTSTSTPPPPKLTPSTKEKTKRFKDYSKKRAHINPRYSSSPNMSPLTPTPRNPKTVPSAASGGIPDPTPSYLFTSSLPAHQLKEPQHLLVVIDLNGTLLYRPNKKTPTKFTARPNTQRFLRYCIDTFTVVIWSSARPENVRNMCDAILSPDMRRNVAAIWGRDKFDLTKEDYASRTQCYKRLTRLWKDESIARSHPAYAQGGRWDQTNTVLVDDSFEKGRSEPFNLIEIPEFFGDGNEQGHILPQVHDYLNYLAMHSNVSACLRASPFRPQLQQLNRDVVEID